MSHLALGNTACFSCQVLQRCGHHPETKPQRDQRHHGQDEHQDGQRGGNLQRQLLGLFRRDGQQDGPGTTGNRLIIDQAAGSARGGDIIKLRRFAALTGINTH